MCSILAISIASTQFCTHKYRFFAFTTSTTARLAPTLHQLITRPWHRGNSQPHWFQIFTNYLPSPVSKIVTSEHSHSRFRPDTTKLTNYVIITYFFFVIFWLQTNVTKKWPFYNVISVRDSNVPKYNVILTPSKNVITSNKQIT